MGSITANLAVVQQRIKDAALRCQRNPNTVRLIVVTKTVEPQRIHEVLRTGQRDLGENKVQEGRSKAGEFADETVRWNMIGHLQTNKVKDALRFANEIQSVDRISLAVTLERRLQFLGKGLDVLVQVNTSEEPSKFGLSPREVPAFLKQLQAFDALRPKGFMTLATFTSEENEVRRCFQLLRHIRDRALQEAPQGARLSELSMGMSADYEWAIEEGATIVRIGQAIFGPRPLPHSYYWPVARGAT